MNKTEPNNIWDKERKTPIISDVNLPNSPFLQIIPRKPPLRRPPHLHRLLEIPILHLQVCIMGVTAQKRLIKVDMRMAEAGSDETACRI